jgi:hypothetical protein
MLARHPGVILKEILDKILSGECEQAGRGDA